MNKREVGSIKEELAAQYLRENGINIREMNFRCRFGEIDIVANDKNNVIFAEVKYRKTASKGHPEEAVNVSKAKTICKVADYYRIRHNLNDSMQFRFDVIAIEGNQIRWYKNAFPYIR